MFPFSPLPRGVMAATVKRQRLRRPACWALLLVLLADLLALSGRYTQEGPKEEVINECHQGKGSGVTGRKSVR